MVEDDFPKTLDWYRDSIKWIVAISAGMMAFSVDATKTRLSASILLRLSFGLTCASFGLAAACGVWAYIWLVEYVNQEEYRAHYEKRAEHETDLSVKAAEEQKVEVARNVRNKAQCKANRYYLWMLKTFMVGLVAFAIMAWLIFFASPPAVVSATALSKAAIFDGRPGG